MGNICSVPRCVLDILWEAKSMKAGDIRPLSGVVQLESDTHLVKVIPRKR